MTLEQLQQAIQDYLRADTGEDRIITGFIIATESVTLATADTENYVNCVGHGTYATRVGLATLLHDDLLQGDDE